ncbi:YjcZ family sporulation protein [Paenibacillus larvae]
MESKEGNVTETYGYKGFTSTGAILVLFILLVIDSRTRLYFWPLS